MTKGMTAHRGALALAATLGAAAPAFAQDSLSGSIERFLNNTQSALEENKIWKIRVRPSLRESVIFTDNVFLNDEDENPVRLLRVQGPGATVITDPRRLEQIAATVPEFRDTETRGRESDFIIQSELAVDFVLPVNEDKSKLFGANEITLLSVKGRNQEYLDVNELDNNSLFLKTDIFGFVNDLIGGEWGNGFWLRVQDDYSKLRDPLDASIRLLAQTGVTLVDSFDDFGREENTFNFDTGWRGSKVDASAGYEKYNLWLDNDNLDQAQHGRHNFHAEVGSLLPGVERLRGYLRYDVWIYHFARAPIRDDRGNEIGKAQILNDATVQQGTIGVNGDVIPDRLNVVLEAGYASWNPHSDGLSADRTHYAGFMPHVRVAYKPWDERSTRLQFEYGKRIGYSAISNFNLEHAATLSLLHELIPERLDGDISVAFTSTSPSDGPDRKLLEAGFGLTYHLFKQADVSFRYLYRHQTARNEIRNQSAFARGARAFDFEVSSDSEFVQNILELSLLLHF